MNEQRSRGSEQPLQSYDHNGNILVKKAPKRKASVYDAVNGNVTQAGFIENIGDIKRSKQPLRPDEVLFKRANAPVRYQENDYYYAHEKLSADKQLPSGDLLSSIHAYVSRLYSRTEEPGTNNIWRSMDETALIAFGILMEETARQELGETGDMALTEGVESDEERELAEHGNADLGIEEPQSSAAKSVDTSPNSWSDSGSLFDTDTAESE